MKDINKFNKFYYGITEWPEYSLNFWNIPKCGATAVKAALLKQEITSPFEIFSELHSTTIRKFITREDAKNNNYLNFTVIRHPYDRVISMYKDFGIRRPLGQHKSEELLNFNYFLDNVIMSSRDETCNPHFRSMSYYIQPEGELLIDNILNFSNVKEFLSTYNLNFQQVNATASINLKLTVQQKEKIYQRYRSDFSLIKYLENI